MSEVVLLAESLRRLYSSSQPPIKSLDVPCDGMSVLLGNVKRGSTGFCNRLVCTVQLEWKQAGVSAASRSVAYFRASDRDVNSVAPSFCRERCDKKRFVLPGFAFS